MAKRTILIADDDQDLVKVLQDRFEYEGYEVLAAGEGVRAIEMAHKKRPDMIILDLKMAAGTGQSVLQALRSRPETRSIPVIILTGLEGRHLEEKMRKAGAQDFLQKPCGPGVVLEKVEFLLRARK